MLVKGVSSRTSVANSSRLIWSCGRRMAWTKRLRRVCLFGQVLVDAAAGVDGQGQVQRQLRLALEDGDLLRTAVFGDGKVVAREAADDGAVAVGHVDEDVDQLHVDVQRVSPARRRA